MADPEIPIESKDDEWVTRGFRMRKRKPGIVIPKGVKITEENLDEYTDPYDLTGKKITATIRTEKPSTAVPPLVLDSDLDGILVQSFEEGLWRFNVAPATVARFVDKPGIFYSVVVTDNGVTDRTWAGDFIRTRR